MVKIPDVLVLRNDNLQNPSQHARFWRESLDDALLKNNMGLHQITFKVKVYKKPNFFHKLLGISAIETKTFTTSEILQPERDEVNGWNFTFWLNSNDQDNLIEMNPYPFGKWNMGTFGEEAMRSIIQVEPQDILVMTFIKKVQQ